MSRSLEIFIYDIGIDWDEEFEIGEDTRHDRPGFRVIRRVHYGEYLPSGEKVYDWDETYLFYENLDDAYHAIRNRDFTAGRQAF